MNTKQHTSWTDEEERRLLELRAAGRSMISISAALKRSASAIRGRLTMMRARKRAEKSTGTEAIPNE
jgi:hypothetical protein